MEIELKLGRRKWLLEMVDEVRTAELGTWACVLLKIEICDVLNSLGGMAGEW
ncbi:MULTISPECIES: hypothetical protein [Burkholderia cepacia complex]|uniref:Uncharacterized protein n=1 Tax=Burkholderia orbicola (strain MC0-3) TaxID=406425 RepID=B1JT04_BURO0|nr:MULTISPECIES: hypothetical protein [Burkholderia cepacia complex]ACA89349.1 hypothetical protein Bcenmc03_0169 [Burkholderia orbicola MC0-3]